MFHHQRSVLATLLVAIAGLALAACSSDGPEDVTIDIAVEDRELTGSTTTFTANQGDTVTLNLSADEEAEFHLHGYDLRESVHAGGSATITFEADATGRFPLAMHVADAEEECQAEANGATVHLMAEAGMEPGRFTVTAMTENFELDGANHWHLFLDGELQGMFFDPSTEVTVMGEGEHELMARLSDGNHCDLPVTDAITVTGMPMDGMMDDGHGHADDAPADDGHGHEHEAGEVEINIAAIEIRP